ncbi:putative RNA-directed DNA polymerase, eukaryota, reverse transcriptase zinc-binding domain protein [Tanacetum coccineum]
MIDGVWVFNPYEVKTAFLKLYKKKFQAQDSSMSFSPITATSVLDDSDHFFLEDMVTTNEIRAAVWACCSNKAPSRDGFSFHFLKTNWELISYDVTKFVTNFFDSCSMPLGAKVQYIIIAKLLANRLSKVVDKIVSHEQSAFISGRQILDGPLMLSEVIEWYKKRNEKLLIFKVYFEKAYDSVCLQSARTSILVNGSPSSEFSIKHGLRQGDPLSSFLFILVMEGLHLALKDVAQSNLIHGAKVGASNFRISHLFYADDVTIVLDWSPRDMDNIIRVLQVFYLALGLKINIHKSNVYGIGVCSEEVSDMARVTGCAAGGLGVGSLKAFNLALLQKWCWRLVHNQYALWVQFIKAVHGPDAGFDQNGCQSQGLWAKIVRSINHLHSSGIIPMGTLKLKVGCGSLVRFWKDMWLGDDPLKLRHNRLFRLDCNEDCYIRDQIVNGVWSWNWSRQVLGGRNTEGLNLLLAEIGNVEVGSGEDSWQWGLHSDGSFSVGVTRKHIDDIILSSIITSTR